MTKPADIPQRVWDEAEKCFPGNSWNPLAIERVSRAILAAEQREREACARIATRDGSSHDATLSQQTPEWQHDTTVAVRTADRIATAIRNRSQDQ